MHGFIRFLPAALLIAQMAMLPTGISAQTRGFSVISADTIRSIRAGDELVFNVCVRNTSTASLTLAFVRTSVTLPAEWNSSICLGSQCLAPFIDSVATTPDFGFAPLASGDTLIFSLHVSTSSVPDSGSVQIVIRELGSAALPVVLTLKGQTSPLNAVHVLIQPRTSKPEGILLEQNYPNPWNPSTRIPFTLAYGGRVCLTVFDMTGRQVAVLFDGLLEAGRHEVIFSASPASPLASGTYLYHLATQEGSRSQIMKFVK